MLILGDELPFSKKLVKLTKGLYLYACGLWSSLHQNWVKAWKVQLTENPKYPISYCHQLTND
jgi:hypothetical protein